VFLTGVVASEMGCLEANENRGKYGATRSRHEGFGPGARNAIEKSAEHLGELGVTMIAGSGDFSSTRGNVRSIKKQEDPLSDFTSLRVCSMLGLT